MGDGQPFAGGQGQTAGTGTELVMTGAQAAGMTPKKKKCKRNVTAKQSAVKEKKPAQLGICKTAKPVDANNNSGKEKKRAQLGSLKAPNPADWNNKQGMPSPKLGAAALRFKRYKKKWPGNYWDICNKARPQDVLKDACQPHRQEEAHLTVLNADCHI
jgi:hypothetical protein